MANYIFGTLAVITFPLWIVFFILQFAWFFGTIVLEILAEEVS